MTVSNAYNRPDQLSAATRAHVLEVAGRLGYAGPDPAAQSLRRGRANTVGVVLTERLPYAFTDPGLIEILHGLTTELSEAGYALLLIPPDAGPGESMVGHAIVDAFVLCSLPAGDPAVTAAVQRTLPIVTVGYPHLPAVPRIGIDNAAAAGLVAQHLLELGHARFGVLGIAGDPGSHQGMHDRAQGFQAYLAAAGVRSTHVSLCRAAENTPSSGAAAIGELLARPARRRPTAVFAVTDNLALGVLQAARAAGLDVPGQLSVAGFDDVAAAASSDPPLTTVSQSLFRQGLAAARLALRAIAGERVRAPRIAPELIVRASTARRPSRRV